MYFVYILKNSIGYLYKGLSKDVERRLREHNSNKCLGTRGKGPWMLIYSEKFINRIEARKREKYFKSGMGREILKHMLK